ncbi:hypothetical protein [uncultured Alsobacter sp.]|uniref:hypothetical protein n=1 Tax=uncultured Alsobacter sp. TaxID=1748258 RepID=UPI0025D01ED9|nr:hypothetical protein [uncultured Alsobacter sp.]
MASRFFKSIPGGAVSLAERVAAIVASLTPKASAVTKAGEIVGLARQVAEERPKQQAELDAEADEAERAAIREAGLLAVGLTTDASAVEAKRADASVKRTTALAGKVAAQADADVVRIAEERRRDAGRALHEAMEAEIAPLREEALAQFRETVAAHVRAHDLAAALGLPVGERPQIIDPISHERLTPPEPDAEARAIAEALEPVRWQIRVTA